jgi:uncharacterized membrane protein YbaN (DUF454 family)
MFFLEFRANVSVGSQPPYFGNHVPRFRAGMGMPQKAKYFSIIARWGSYSLRFSLLCQIQSMWIKYFILLSAVIGTFYIIKQPDFEK